MDDMIVWWWILLLFHFAAVWNPVLGGGSTAQLGCHREAVCLGGKDRKSQNR